MTQRLRSDILVQSILRTVQSRSGFATVRHRGHEEGGVVYLTIALGPLVDAYVETQDRDGTLAWRAKKLQADEQAIIEMIQKERRFDPDLWVVDVEGGVTLADLPGKLMEEY